MRGGGGGGGSRRCIEPIARSQFQGYSVGVGVVAVAVREDVDGLW